MIERPEKLGDIPHKKTLDQSAVLLLKSTRKVGNKGKGRSALEYQLAQGANVCSTWRLIESRTTLYVHPSLYRSVEGSTAFSVPHVKDTAKGFLVAWFGRVLLYEPAQLCKAHQRYYLVIVVFEENEKG